jgi:archaemetzincin
MRNFIVALLTLCIIGCSDKPAKDTVTEAKTVGIIPYKGISSEKTAMIKKAVEDYYKVDVSILPEQIMPKSAFVNIKSPRYRADSIIIIQRRNMPKDLDYIMGLTESDISVTKRNPAGKIKSPEWKYNDFGIMGLAYRPGNSCVVSGYRLKHKNKEVHFGRFKKVVIHELGHNFGLPHCPDKKCVMTSAVERIATIDNARPEVCNACKQKLRI